MREYNTKYFTIEFFQSCLTLKTFKRFENLSKLSYLSVLEWKKWRSSRSTIITEKFHRFLQSRNAKCFCHLGGNKQDRRTVTETISTNTRLQALRNNTVMQLKKKATNLSDIDGFIMTSLFQALR